MALHTTIITAALLSIAAMLSGCGGGSGPSPAPGPSPGPPAPGPSPPPAPPSPMQPFRPIRAISYKTLPCTYQDLQQGGICQTTLPGNDMAQAGYASQWGSNGRDDLGMMKTLGANAVRLYDSLGAEEEHDHGAFLDRAQQVGLHVILGFHTQNVCTSKFDCYDSWYRAASAGFSKQNFLKGKQYHSAIAMIVLMDEPDIPNFGGSPQCPKGEDPNCRMTAVLSGLDGLLQAEKDAGITGSLPNITVAWSFTPRDSIDGKVVNGLDFGFQDVTAVLADPSLVDYANLKTSKADLLKAFKNRWVHGTSTQSPWSYVQLKLGSIYDARYAGTPWWISEYGNTVGVAADLKTMNGIAAVNSSSFMGATVFRFAEDNSNNGTFGWGLFGEKEGTSPSWTTGDICHTDVNSHHTDCKAGYTVRCLGPNPKNSDRAQAVASGWGGHTRGHGSCPSDDVEVVV